MRTRYDDATDALLRELAAAPEVRAIGETGLDYFRNYSPHAAQIAAFERQLAIAVDTGKPLFLHQRDAHADFIACLDNVRGPHFARGRALLHGRARRARRVPRSRVSYRRSRAGSADERRGMHLRELVKLIPADRLMIETDAPYLLPRDLHPKPSHRRNEPMYLAHVCAAVAAARGEAVERSPRRRRRPRARFSGSDFRLSRWRERPAEGRVRESCFHGRRRQREPRLPSP